jgi:hypothetical protein
LGVAQHLKAPIQILVKEDGKFWRIMRHQFDINESPPVLVDEDLLDEEYEPVEEEEAPF